MRIAWVTYDFEEYSARHVNALCKEHDVLLVMPCAEGDESNHAIDCSVTLYAFAKPRLRQPRKQWTSLRLILQRIHEFQPDVVHFQQGHLWFNLVLGAVRKRYPLVITIHDPRHHAGDAVSRKTPQWWMDYGFRKADDVIVHGDALATQVEHLFGLGRDRIHVIPHISMGDAAAERVASEDGNLILFFGRIWDYKGLEQLIAAQPLISRAVPEARIMIAGTGEDFGRYRALMEDPGKFIVHNAWISDQERARLFQKSAIVVLPYHEATQSGVVPVAYNFSKPVVATRVGALAECIEDGVTGLLIPPRDPRAIATAIIALLQDPERRRRMGQAGKAKLDRESSPEVVSAQTVAAYRTALSHRARTAVPAPCPANSPANTRIATRGH